jgi:ATP-dependent DNA helicase RecG
MEVKVNRRRPPVSVRGKYYQRVGNTTREVTGDELKRLFLKGESWGAITDERFSLEDINDEDVMDFLQSARREGRVPADFENDDIKEILRRLDLLRENKLTNAAILLFGKDPQKYFSNAVVKIGRFRDEATIVADRTVSGNLFHQVREAEEQIKSLINRRYEIPDDSFQRRDVWQYPLPAVREALLNALVHRNYFEMSVKIQVKVFDELLWIFNPGKLPSALTIADLKKAHSSYPRNKLIATTFYRVGLIEEWGSGIQRMINALKEENLAEPEFEEQGEGFVIKLFGQKTSITKLGFYEDLNSRQVRAMNYLQDNETIDNATYRKLNDISKRTAARDLKALVEKEYLEQMGSGPGIYYQLA